MNIKNITLQGANIALSIIKGVICLKLLVTLGDYNYAFISQFLVISAFLAQVMFLNYDAPMVSSIISGQSEGDINGALNIMLILFIIIAIFIILPNKVYYSELVWNDSSLHNFIKYVVIYTFIQAVSLRLLLVFQYKKKLDLYARYKIYQSLCQLLAIFIGVVFSNKHVILALLVMLEMSLILSTLAKVNYRRFLFFNKRSIQWLKDNIKIAFSLLFMTFVIWIINNSGRFIIVSKFDLNILAVYASSFSTLIIISSIINPLVALIFPYISTDRHKFTIIGIGVVSFITFSMTFFMVIFGLDILKFFAKEELYAGKLFFIYICIGINLYGITRIMVLYNVVSSNAKKSIFAFFSGAIALLITSYLFIDHYGVVSIAFSYLMANLVVFVFYVNQVYSVVKESKLVSIVMFVFIYFIAVVLLLLCYFIADYSLFDRVILYGGLLLLLIASFSAVYRKLLWEKA